MKIRYYAETSVLGLQVFQRLEVLESKAQRFKVYLEGQGDFRSRFITGIGGVLHEL